ncbi:hypothetical protein HMPREF3187_01230 [Aerococcus christensenii]|uniref:Uncharacterized protein n=1 Tax=Aerococcus christensenii TaxID=87541 RepID=A0A133XVC6_9LACT|nr:hypothetical protein HMPREF3187_01230 [Aerococcus christensenii]
MKESFFAFISSFFSYYIISLKVHILQQEPLFFPYKSQIIMLFID